MIIGKSGPRMRDSLLALMTHLILQLLLLNPQFDQSLIILVVAVGRVDLQDGDEHKHSGCSDEVEDSVLLEMDEQFGEFRGEGRRTWRDGDLGKGMLVEGGVLLVGLEVRAHRACFINMINQGKF